jgi:hypothetical protein
MLLEWKYLACNSGETKKNILSLQLGDLQK